MIYFNIKYFQPFQTILFFIIFDLVNLFVISQNIPSPRYKQASSLVNIKFYFFGGLTKSSLSPSYTNEVWYLDLSNSFNITTPPWHKDFDMPIAYSAGSSCVNLIDNSSVFIIGGNMIIPNTTTFDYSSSVYIFNSKNSQWTIPNINGFNSNFTLRDEMQAVFVNNGKIFIFGGSDGYNYYSDLNILDITTMTWSLQYQHSLTYVDYTANLLPNGLIVYIGGREGSSSTVYLVNMNQTRTFDTKSYTWSTKVSGGSIISARIGHSTVLTQDGNIIIYGGSIINSSGYIDNLLSDVAVLNTNTWTWSIPSISQTNAPPPLTFHSAAIYKNYMIIAFGLIASVPMKIYSNNIYILNTQNYTWITTIFISSDESKSNNKVLFIGIGIGMGGIVLTGILIIGIILYCKNYKNNFVNVLSIPGESVPRAHLLVPGTDLSGTPVPGTRISGTPVPGARISGTPVPGTRISGTPVPGTRTSGTSVPGTHISGTPVHRTRIPDTPVPGTYTSRTLIN
ncbi:galactose oxidase [Gigaspora margarita]|uniref:Galactose oxidase n=1 Tax=Gigaspora margarita TaxID=4874 RepID=A0A8H4ELT0_GIGMA|nr:galactose oxidase [Gigaspora margarita]